MSEVDRYRIQPGTRVRLNDWNPKDRTAFDGGKKEADRRLRDLNRELEALQELLYAEHQHRVLVVLQGMDTSGKDGTILHVFEGVNPQGVRVAGFKRPTPIELDHDFLWRIHAQAPARGEIVIFNRSHYEDVLVVRVHELVPPEVWARRYEHINAFERMLAEEGTIIRKFFLNIDKDEQKQRLQARLDEPAKHWKFDPNDLNERQRWDEYVAAYEEVLSRTSTVWAPWYVVPANRKWYRNLIVATVLVDTLKSLDMRHPEPRFNPADIHLE